MNTISSTAVGVDGISIQMLKALSPYCIGAVTHLVNRSLISGSFPSSWKSSIVIPLPKISNPSLVSHFRPISILPAISKVLEKVVAEQLATFMEGEGLLSDTQSGFRKGFSTTTALLNMLDELMRAKDQGCNSMVVSLDSVHLLMLLAILMYLKFDESAIEWFAS